VLSIVIGECVSLETLLKTCNIGMTGCLGVGSSAAKTLAAALDKPLVGVHHMVYPLSLAFDP
jgi:N6-L-threonylcarbamoyladenine synthase